MQAWNSSPDQKGWLPSWADSVRNPARPNYRWRERRNRCRVRCATSADTAPIAGGDASRCFESRRANSRLRDQPIRQTIGGNGQRCVPHYGHSRTHCQRLISNAGHDCCPVLDSHAIRDVRGTVSLQFPLTDTDQRPVNKPLSGC